MGAVGRELARDHTPGIATLTSQICNSERTVPGTSKLRTAVPLSATGCSCSCPAAGLEANVAGHARCASCQMPCGRCARAQPCFAKDTRNAILQGTGLALPGDARGAKETHEQESEQTTQHHRSTDGHHLDRHDYERMRVYLGRHTVQVKSRTPPQQSVASE